MKAWLMLLLLLAACGSHAAPKLPQSLSSCVSQILFLEGRFSQSRHINVLVAPLLSSGQFRYRKGEGLLWHTTEPVDNEIRFVSGKGMITKDGEGWPHVIPGTKPMAGLFLGLFSCNPEDLGDYFTIAKEVEGDRWSLRLTPKHSGMSEQIEAILIEGGKHVERVDIRESNGDRRELIFEVTDLKTAGDS